MDPAQAPCIGSVDAKPLDHQGSPLCHSFNSHTTRLATVVSVRSDWYPFFFFFFRLTWLFLASFLPYKFYDQLTQFQKGKKTKPKKTSNPGLTGILLNSRFIFGRSNIFLTQYLPEHRLVISVHVQGFLLWSLYKNLYLETSLVVQWLRLHAPNAGDLCSIPGLETRSHILQ